MRFALAFLFLLPACVGAPPDVVPVTDSGATDAKVEANVPDASGADADAAKPWDPSQLAGIALWLDGDGASPDANSKISTWSDKSGNANDAKQPTPAKAPALASTMINGHKAVHFAGSVLVIADKASLQWKKSFVVEAIVRHTKASSVETGMLYYKPAPASPFSGPELIVGTGGASAYPLYAALKIDITPGTQVDTSAQAAPSEDAAHRVRASWDAVATTLSIQIDKSAAVTKSYPAATGLDATGSDVNVGQGGSGFFPYTGDIAELVAVAGATVSPADVAQLDAYLDAKYGL